jgi:CBS domain-containing protein
MILWLREKLSLQVSDLLGKKPVTISSDATILQAAKLLARENVGLLVVVNSSKPNVPVGVVSERDLIHYVAQEKPLSAMVSSIASTELITVRRHDKIGKAASLMVSNRIRHLVVLDDYDESLVGVISIRDVLERAVIRETLSAYFSET